MTQDSTGAFRFTGIYHTSRLLSKDPNVGTVFSGLRLPLGVNGINMYRRIEIKVK